MEQKTYIIDNLDCANCAAKIEAKINALPEVKEATITFATKQLRITAENPDALVEKLTAIAQTVESGAVIRSRKGHHHEQDHGCGCGHHHEQDHHCSCGCHHEHDHGCGCDHHHEHKNECGCGHHHGHEHSHDHGHGDDDKKTIFAGAGLFAS